MHEIPETTLQQFEEAQNRARKQVAEISPEIEQLENEPGDGGGGPTPTEEGKSCLHMLYCNRSRAFLEMCMIDEALQDAELAIEANPEYANAYVRRATILLDLFKHELAKKDLGKAHELDSTLDLSEEIQRAAKKKYVPNCYARKQLELRLKFKCDYVIQFEYEGEDIVEPAFAEEGRSFSREIGYSMRTGEGDTKGLVGMIARSFTSKIRTRMNDSKKLSAMVKEQLTRELGPEKDYDVKWKVTNPRHWPVIYWSSQGWSPMNLMFRQQPMLFPGAHSPE